MKSVITASIVGAVVLFLFGFVYWGLLPTTQRVFDGATDEAELAAAIRSNVPEPGVYMIPGPSVFSDQEAFSTQHEEGPVVMMFVHPDGLPVMPASMMIGGFFNNLIAILIMAVLLLMVAPALPTYGSRVTAVVLAALAMVVLADLGDPVWWRHTWGFYVAQAVYHAVGWLLVGLVLAYFIRPETAKVRAR